MNCLAPIANATNLVWQQKYSIAARRRRNGSSNFKNYWIWKPEKRTSNSRINKNANIFSERTRSARLFYGVANSCRIYRHSHLCQCHMLQNSKWNSSFINWNFHRKTTATITKETWADCYLWQNQVTKFWRKVKQIQRNSKGEKNCLSLKTANSHFDSFASSGELDGLRPYNFVRYGNHLQIKLGIWSTLKTSVRLLNPLKKWSARLVQPGEKNRSYSTEKKTKNQFPHKVLIEAS